MSIIENKACEAYEENRNLPVKYQIGDAMWMDWYAKGYHQAKEDLGIVKIHCLTRKPGDHTFFLQKMINTACVSNIKVSGISVKALLQVLD